MYIRLKIKHSGDYCNSRESEQGWRLTDAVEILSCKGCSLRSERTMTSLCDWRSSDAATP